MQLLRVIQRPEFFFNPRQVWRRLRKNSLVKRNAVQLAWGLPIELDPATYIGVDIVNIGVHDRVVPEAIWRLLDPGEQAFDIGANIGQNTSIMALKAGPRGRVVAFEPGPLASRLLTRNVERWGSYQLSPISVVRQGVSCRVGLGVLHEAADLGAFSLEDQPVRAVDIAPNGAKIEIDLITLDAYAISAGEIGLIKIDVEGHEQAVLQGAAHILNERRVRDIVFEDYQPQPSSVTTGLQAAGYEVFCLLARWRKPMLLTLAQRGMVLKQEPHLVNFLATRDAKRVLQRFEGAGWKCLKVQACPRIKE
jgi:FkbM family methyltransferase